MSSHMYVVLEKQCMIINGIILNKRRRIQVEVFNKIRSFRSGKYRQIGKGLVKLSGLAFGKSSNQLITFFNEAETLLLAYNLIVKRLRSLKWERDLTGMGVSDVGRTYLHALFIRQPDKYEYTEDLIENNSHMYFLLLDDVLAECLNRRRRLMLLYGLFRIKNHEPQKQKKLERMLQIFTKYQEKQVKIELVEFLSQVNAVIPRDKLLSLLHRVCSFYVFDHKKEAMHRIKLFSLQSDLRSKCYARGLQYLCSLAKKKEKQCMNSVAHRTHFPLPALAPNGYQSRLYLALHRLLQSTLAGAFSAVKVFRAAEVMQSVELERLRVQRLKKKEAEQKEKYFRLLSSPLERWLIDCLGHSFRSILVQSKSKNSLRDKVVRSLLNLFLKKELAAFMAIKDYAEKAHARKLKAYREGLTDLDYFFKNKMNVAFSQIKTVIMRLETLNVANVTSENRWAGFALNTSINPNDISGGMLGSKDYSQMILLEPNGSKPAKAGPVLGPETGRNFLLPPEESRAGNPGKDSSKLKKSLEEPATAIKSNPSQHRNRDSWTTQKPAVKTAEKSRVEGPASKDPGSSGKLVRDALQDDSSFFPNSLQREAKKVPSSTKNEKQAALSEVSVFTSKNRRSSIPKAPHDDHSLFLDNHTSKGGRKPDILILTDKEELFRDKEPAGQARKLSPLAKQSAPRLGGKKVYLNQESNPLEESRNQEVFRSNDVPPNPPNRVKVNN